MDHLGHYSINLTSEHIATYGCVCDLCNSVFEAFINMGGSTTLSESHLTGKYSTGLQDQVKALSLLAVDFVRKTLILNQWVVEH